LEGYGHASEFIDAEIMGDNARSEVRGGTATATVSLDEMETKPHKTNDPRKKNAEKKTVKPRRRA
jgi:hypothetical protein